MPIIAENKGGSFEIAPAGNFAARCFEMIHVGTIIESVMGKEQRLNKVRLTFELPTELKEFNHDKGPEPAIISKEFTLSMHEKASLRKYLESWRGKRFDDEQAKAFDVTVLIGKACMVNIVHIISNKGTTYADITAITPLPKGLECPPQINKTFILSYDNFDHEGFEKLPDYIKNKVKSSAEYKRMMDPNKPEPEQKEKLVAPNGEEIDDLPF